jgi:hypothetical protein
MAFFTRHDDLRFRRTTWLLCKLLVTGPQDDTPSTPGDRYSPTPEVVALQQLCSLANLFVRKHEIVAVIPTTGIPRQESLYVAAQKKNGPLRDCILTLDIASETDILPDSERLQARVVVVPHKQVPLRNDAIPSEDHFLQHVQNVFSFLKEAASIHQRLHKMKEGDEETTKMLHHYTDLKLDLEFYITRTCFEKISTRAGYHCAAAVRDCDRKDEKDTKENQQREGGSSKDDFTPLLYPMSSWREDHMNIATEECSNKAFSKIYQSLLSKEPFSFDMIKIFEKKKDERAKFDPNMWNDAEWTDPEPLHSDLLRCYKLGLVERIIWKDLAGLFDLGHMPEEEGFYLTAAGRRAYHQLVTTCVWNALLYLNLLKKNKDAVADELQVDSDITRLTHQACWALHHLEMLAYRSPILGIHLDWLDKKNPNTKRKSNEIEKPTNSDISDEADDNRMDEIDDNIMGEADDNIMGEEADVVPCLKEMVVRNVKTGGRGGAAKEPSSSFLVSGGRGAAVLRWLRLTTLHNFAIYNLLSTNTVKKLPQLSLNLVQTTLPCEDEAMQPLEPYFNGMETPLDSEDIRLFVEAMQRQEKNVDVFKGTYHCEAILLSLYLLHHETRDNEDASFGLPAFVADDLEKAAGNFFPGVVAVSKRCCPVCNQLFHTVHEILGKPYNIIGTHAAYSACALPPFLPKKYAQMVADALEKQLEPALENYLKGLRKRRTFDRGSSSPGHHLQEEPDIEVGWLGVTHYGGFKNNRQNNRPAGSPAN